MAGLTTSQLKIIMTLVETAPDAAIRSLDMALAAEAGADGPMAAIRDLVSAEAGERRARRITFAPLSGMCANSVQDGPRKALPRQTLTLLWKALKSELPDQVSLAVASVMQSGEDEEASPVFDSLCSAAAGGLRDRGNGAYAAATAMLESHNPGGAAEVASFLDLAPLSRSAMSKLSDWVARMTDERAAAVRLAYRDAAAISPDSGPKLLEVLAARLDEPWLILRLVGAIHEHSSDRFLHGSELREICERVLDDVDRRLDEFSSFDPLGGVEAGYAAANNLIRAVAEISEFELAIELKKDGPWGTRVLKQKALLGKHAETILKKVEDAVAAALPLKAPKYGKGLRGSPTFLQSPDPAAVSKAEAMMAFLDRSRGPSQAGGFASLRAKVIERIDDRLDDYVDDVLDNLRSDDPDEPERAAEYMEVVAALIGLYRDEKAAQIVRRRAAA